MTIKSITNLILSYINKSETELHVVLCHKALCCMFTQWRRHTYTTLCTHGARGFARQPVCYSINLMYNLKWLNIWPNFSNNALARLTMLSTRNLWFFRQSPCVMHVCHLSLSICLSFSRLPKQHGIKLYILTFCQKSAKATKFFLNKGQAVNLWFIIFKTKSVCHISKSFVSLSLPVFYQIAKTK